MEVFATLEASVYVIYVEELKSARLKSGDSLNLSSRPDHWMSLNQKTPALMISFLDDSGDEHDIGSLTSYRDSPRLYPWLTAAEIIIGTRVSSCTTAPEPSLNVRIRISGPCQRSEFYLSRMLWALPPAIQPVYKRLNAPQAPPPRWQLVCLRDFNVRTEISADAKRTGLDTLDIYTGGTAPSLPLYEKEIPALKTQLYPHQLQALKWARAQEKPSLPTDIKTVQMWMRTRRQTYYHQVARAEQAELKLYGGGLLADDMTQGLGKTLTMLALILTTKAKTIKGFSGSTLIIAPLSVLSVWAKEIQERCEGLSHMVYHPTQNSKYKSQPPPSNLIFEEYDVVITNYATLLKEDCPLFSVNWRRIILDEAHNIKNSTSRTHQAALNLNAHTRWALTGTPIVNKLEDLRSLLAFLRLCHPLSERKYWDQHVGPGTQSDGGRHRAETLKKLLGCICLRRTKEMVDVTGSRIITLPKVTCQKVSVTMDTEQQSVYDGVVSSAQHRLLSAKENSEAPPPAETIKMILRLRQAVVHPALVPANAWKLPKNICTKCFGTLSEEEEIYLCAKDEDHVTCSSCVSDTATACYCGAGITSKYLANGDFSASTKKSSLNDDAWKTKSAKLDALVSLLRETPHAEKCLVFSSFVSFLGLVERRLSHECIQYVSFNGRMAAEDREMSLTKFRDGNLATDSKAPRVMLLSLQAGGVGLNLNVANHVFLMDPWWQPSLERQAIDRVNRLGQTREVNVYRLVAKHTIEDAVLDVQEQKARLIGQVLSDTKSASHLSYSDVQAATRNTLDIQVVLDALRDHEKSRSGTL